MITEDRTVTADDCVFQHDPTAIALRILCKGSSALHAPCRDMTVLLERISEEWMTVPQPLTSIFLVLTLGSWSFGASDRNLQTQPFCVNLWRSFTSGSRVCRDF